MKNGDVVSLDGRRIGKVLREMLRFHVAVLQDVAREVLDASPESPKLACLGEEDGDGGAQRRHSEQD